MQHSLLTCLAASCILALVTSCSADATSSSSNDPEVECKQGEIVNQITGKCIPAGTADMAMSGAPKDQGAQGGGGEGEADMKGSAGGGDDTKDMAKSPDLSQPPLDMKRALDMSAPPAVDMSPGMEKVVRFVALGDTGEGSETQRKVGRAVGTVCQLKGGCEFGMLLGDNAYDSGVKSADDPFFDDIFVTPYSALGFPFYVVLGNHDLGGDGLGVDRDFKKGDYQVEYSKKNPQWMMPAKYYQATRGSVWLLGLNTTNIFFGQDRNQRQDIPGWIQGAPANAWKIAFGHHPYISNGKHGNAGSYEGLPFVPIANGEHVESFMKDHICGKVDLYLSGHDHSLQDLKPTCSTEFIVSGAGAKTTKVDGKNPVYFEARKTGFVLLEATSKTLSVTFYDENATMLHQRTMTR